MALSHFRILFHLLLNKYPDIVSEKASIIILVRNSTVCMYKNGKNNKNTRHISRGVNSIRNGEKCKMHMIDWFEGGLKLTDIATKNVGENELNPRMKYIMVRLDNWSRKLVQ